MRVAAFLIGALLLPAVLPAAHAQNPTTGETRIWNGFMHLGMSRDKAWCYSQIIGQMLDQNETNKAGEIVESAQNGDAVQQGVMNAGGPMISAFSSAHNTCGQ